MSVGVYIHQLNAGFMQARDLPALPITPQSWPQAAPFHNRAFPDQHNFVGRAALLRATKKALDAGRDVALTQPVAMHGAGGVGKTRAAVEFARAHGSSYTLRLFLDAQSPDALRASLADTATKLRLTEDPQASTHALVLLALRLLRAVPTALVVADNADTPEALEAVRLLCHQPGGVRWLITTRLTDLGEEFAPQRVDLLDEPEAVQLLQKRGSKNGHQPGPDAEARSIALDLGRLPLALQQAAAYVAHMRLTWAAYSRLLADNPAEALSHEAKEMKDVPESILRTYSISIAQITPVARRLLEIASHLAPAPIPEAVFLHEDEDGTKRSALVELADFSLIGWQSGQVEVHRAIVIAVRHGLSPEDRRTRLEQACGLVSDCAPIQTQHPDNWPSWAALRPQIEYLLEKVGVDNSSAKTFVRLVTLWPNFLSAIGEYAAAEVFYRESIACLQKIYGAEHSYTLASRNNLANALYRLGRPAKAEKEQRDILLIKERVLGMEHYETLVSRMNLGNSLNAQGKYIEAEKVLRMVLLARERIFGTNNPETLGCRMNLASVLGAQGAHSLAGQEYREIWLLLKPILGEGHPETLRCQMNLANALDASGNHIEAEQMHRDVLNVRVQVLGVDHPDIFKSRMNLASALASLGRYVEAELEFRAVLEFRERVLDAEHSDIALCCYNLALCLDAQHKLPEAFQFMQRAEQLWHKLLGPDHPDTKDATAARHRLEAALKEAPPSP